MGIIFSDGIFTPPEEKGEDVVTGTYTVDGTTITIIEDYETIIGTINADSTLTLEMSNSGGCFDHEDNEIQGATD